MEYRVEFLPLGKGVEVEAEIDLMGCAKLAGVDLVSVCGGRGQCGKCVVRLLDGQLSPPTDAERSVLGKKGIMEGYRLACQARVLGPCRVRVEAESLSASQRTVVEGMEVEVAPDAPVKCREIRLFPPSLEDPSGDVDRVALAMGMEGGSLHWDLGTLRSLSHRMRSWGWRARVPVRGREVVGILREGEAALGVAVDLGTTKIALYLVDLEQGRTIKSTGLMNPQGVYGEDVITRLSRAVQTPSDALEMQRSVVESLNRSIDVLCKKEGYRLEQVLEVVVAGNTAMHHLLVGLPVEQLARSPYVPAVCAPVEVKARELGLQVGHGAYIYLIPNIAGFVGGDHVAMLLACGVHRSEAVTLALDIGTNTEVCLKVDDRMKSASCASGPAFEGAHMQCGMRAAAGAIEHVRIQGDEVIFSTVGKAPAAGICGSGVVDAVSEMLREGIVDQSGRLREHPRVRVRDGQREFVLVNEEEGKGPIVLTQRDIRQLQLAKGAIRAGIEVLLSEGGIEADEIQRIVLAGAFGTYLDIQSVMRIGMLPPVPTERVVQVGNAAGSGATAALLSLEHRREAERLARRVEYLELAAWSGFSDLFARSMRLGPELWARLPQGS